MRNTLFGTLMIAALVAVLGCTSPETREAKNETKPREPNKPVLIVPGARLVNQPAAEITAPDTDGKVFSLSDYKGKVVMLDFWGNW